MAQGKLRAIGRSVRTSVVVVGCVALLAACGGSGSSDTTVGGDDAGDAGSDQQLAVAIGAEPRTLDPHTAEDGQRETFQFTVYETLVFRYGEDMELEPVLAESWDVVDNVWTFDLRQGVTFHDGSELTADDVVASFDRVMSEGSELAGSRAAGITDVRAVNDQTVEIETEQPDPTLPAKTTLIPIATAELAAAGDDAFNSTMVGTGPYRFVEWARGQRIDLEAYSDYWGDPAPFPSAVVRFLPEDSTRLASIRAGEIDIALKMPTEFEGQAPAVVTAPSPDVYTLFFNTVGGGPFEDPAIGLAANLAIDRQGIIDQLLGGHGEQVLGQFVGQYVFGSTPNLEEHPYDAEAARQVLDDAGATGVEITLSATTGRWPKDREIAEAVVGMLEEAGFSVNLELPELSQWFEGLFGEPSVSPDVFLAGHGNDLFDMERSVAWITCGVEISHYCDPEVDQLIGDARSELDPDVRLGIYDDMWQIVFADNPYAAISTIEQVHFVGEDIDWTPRADGFVLLQTVNAG